MTRINCVPPSELTTKHLMAEYYELPRVFVYAQRAAARGWDAKDSPRYYKLGKGHVKFFAIRLAYLSQRYSDIYQELISRGVKATRPSLMSSELIKFSKTQSWMWLSWAPRPEDQELNRARLRERSPGEYA